jgi:NitT/TauT family transport system substrate-binding protein
MALRPGANTGRGRRGLRRFAGVAALALPALLLATSCSLLNGSSGSPATTASGSQGLEHPNIKVGTMSVMDCVTFQIALQKGYFKQEGLNVTAQTVVSGTESVPKVQSGVLDFGFTNWGTVLAQQAKQQGDFKIVADGSQGAPNDMAVTTWPGSGINNLRDLIGRTVSTNAYADTPFLALKAILQANNIDINKLKIVIVPHPQTPQALATHQVDAALQLEPYKTQAAIQTGARPVVDLYAPGGPTADLPLGGWFTSAAFAKANPKTVAAFARAMEKGAADAANRKLVEQIIPTYTKIDKQTASLVSLPAFPTTLDAKRLQRVSDLMQQYGLLQNHLDVASMIIASPPLS